MPVPPAPLEAVPALPDGPAGAPRDEILARNLREVRARLLAAAARAGRDPAGVRLVVVTKTAPVEAIRALLRLGVNDLGENRVAEAEERIGAVGPGPASSAGAPPGPTWHLIGHLQRNKVRRAVRLFPVIHSADSVKLLADLARIAREEGRRPEVLLEVNVAGEAGKSGFTPDGAVAAAREAAGAIEHGEHGAISVVGLMAMAPFSQDPERSRPHFRALRAIRDEAARASGLPLPHLSMGMSQDYEVAVEEGATMVRVGSAIVGRT
ncbi:MAG: YggS family pyridoxal phosphate-dependent enzyme [Planctomycetales bacterium]|nr:YggS family pyridoxal phosphate-dependent enzyme [Planctomycetales bacterium]